jgi:hypothetical protein
MTRVRMLRSAAARVGEAEERRRGGAVEAAE